MDVITMVGSNNTHLHPSFQRDFYHIQRKFFKLFGGEFRIYDDAGEIVFFAEQKSFKLKEDFRIYSDETKQEELLRITTPHILDIGASYNIYDSTTGEHVGTVRRRFISSFIQDTWDYVSPDGEEIGGMVEPGLLGALLSRLTRLIPQKYVCVDTEGWEVARINMLFNVFVLRYNLTITNPESDIDIRLIIAGAILLAAIEGKEST